jgi:hypothetical protein
VVRCGNVVVIVSRFIASPSGISSATKADAFTAYLAWKAAELSGGNEVLGKETGRTNGVFDIYSRTMGQRVASNKNVNNNNNPEVRCNIIYVSRLKERKT